VALSASRTISNSLHCLISGSLKMGQVRDLRNLGTVLDFVTLAKSVYEAS
jgi:hypothetical protein